MGQPDQAGDDTGRPNPDWGAYGLAIASSTADRPRRCPLSTLAKKRANDDFQGRGSRMVNRAYPE